jgi:hypothetical protein
MLVVLRFECFEGIVFKKKKKKNGIDVLTYCCSASRFFSRILSFLSVEKERRDERVADAWNRPCTARRNAEDVIVEMFKMYSIMYVLASWEMLGSVFSSNVPHLGGMSMLEMLTCSW